MNLSNRLFLYFIPSFISLLVSFVMIPLTTARLDPKDFGLYALLCSIGALVTSLSVLGSSYLWAAYFPCLIDSEKPIFVSTLLSTGIVAIILWSIFFWLLWPLHEYLNLRLGEETRLFYGLVLISSIFSYAWIHVVDCLTLEARAQSYAVITIASSLASAMATLFCLYYLNLHVGSLFIGNIANALVLFAGSLLVLKRYLKFHYSKKWMRVIFNKGIPTTPGNIMESGAISLERNILSAKLSLNSLGLYTHSQSYKNLFSVGIKALARTIWPVSLAEARAKSSDFPQTRAAWEPLFFLLTLGGLISGAVGKEVITILTHGKFTEVAGYVTCWFIFIAIQNAGKEHIAVLYAANQGVFVTYLIVFCQFFFIGLLVILVPVLGIWGAIIAAILQQMTYRVFIQVKANRIQKTPFNDRMVLVSIAFIATSFGVQILLWKELELRLIADLMLMSFYVFLSIDIVRELYSLAGRKIGEMFRLIGAVE